MSDSQPLVLRTPLDEVHAESGATFTEFAGWRLPLRYSGDLAEHRAVRTAAGLFDISHMGQITVTGAGAPEALAGALASDVRQLEIGRAKYTMICNQQGGVLDDLIVYRISNAEYRVIANAANSAVVFRELVERASGFDAKFVDRTLECALLSLQGPDAANVMHAICDSVDELPRRFRFEHLVVAGRRAFVARTGYTGEDGFEISIDRDHAVEVWQALLGAGDGTVLPAGLGARDSLRLEAALPLYGHELSTIRTPYAAGYGSVVDLDHDFVGVEALRIAVEDDAAEVLIGLQCSGARSPRQGYDVLSNVGTRVGAVTSGGPSPTLGVPIAMAYADRAVAVPGTALSVDVRGRTEAAVVVALPFYRRSPK